MYQSHTSRLTELWSLPRPAQGLNTNNNNKKHNCNITLFSNILYIKCVPWLSRHVKYFCFFFLIFVSYFLQPYCTGDQRTALAVFGWRRIHVKCLNIVSTKSVLFYIGFGSCSRVTSLHSPCGCPLTINSSCTMPCWQAMKSFFFFF